MFSYIHSHVWLLQYLSYALHFGFSFIGVRSHNNCFSESNSSDTNEENIMTICFAHIAN